MGISRDKWHKRGQLEVTPNQ